MRFKDKVVIVTGSARGIGKAIAIAFAGEGAHLVLADIAAEEPVSRYGVPGTVRDTAEEIRALGGRVLAVKTDVRLAADAEEMAKQAVQEFGRIDVLVNAAAATEVTLLPFHEKTQEECDYQIDTTFKGVLNSCRAVIPQMMSQQSGRIINITSAAAKTQLSPNPVYAACKAGVAHFSRILAQQLGRSGILVNCVAPGVTRTDVVVAIFTQEGLDASVAALPIPRLGEPEEIADAVLFLASDEARYVTGQHLSVDGGVGPY